MSYEDLDLVIGLEGRGAADTIPIRVYFYTEPGDEPTITIIKWQPTSDSGWEPAPHLLNNDLLNEHIRDELHRRRHADIDDARDSARRDSRLTAAAL